MGTEAPTKLTGIKPTLKPVNIIEINRVKRVTKILANLKN